MNVARKTLIPAIVSIVLMGLTGTGLASDDHDKAKKLQAAGTILPLEQVLEEANRQHPGRVLETELEHKKGRYIYEIKLVDDKGIVWELKYDAKTAELLKEEQES